MNQKVARTQTLSFDEAMIRSTETLQTKYSAEHSLHFLLKILGEFYQSDSSYIFEFDQEEQVFTNQYQWRHEDTDSVASQFGNLPFSVLEYFSSDRVICEEATVFSFETHEYPELPLSKLLTAYDIDNIVIYPIIRKSMTTGFVGIINVDLDDFDIRFFPCAVLFVQECLHKREMHLQLSSLHQIDPLTGCFNDKRFLKQVNSLEQTPPKSLGVVFVQLNGLEKTGEIYGEKYVDLKIKNAAQVMGEFFTYPFYRVETQKFICFLPDVEEKTVTSLVEQLRLEASSNSDACFNVGYTWTKENVNVREEISRSNSNKQRTCQAPVQETVLSATECLQNDLLRAMVHDDYRVYLQPKVILTTGKVIGAEALVRRFIPKTGGLVTPDVFVPLYEHHSIISYLDMHVLKQVCEILANWRDLGKKLIPISVNFSRVTLMESGVGEQIVAMCSQYDIPLSYLQIEITERLGKREEEMSSLVVDDFEKLGLTLVLDDFGSTYSNFLTLAKAHIDELKIDHTLVDNMLRNEKNRKLLISIIDMCRSMDNMKCLAEGIETKEQWEMLRDMNCDYGQGFYFSRPLAIQDFYQNYIK